MIVRNLLMVTAIAISQIACSDVVEEDATRTYAFKQLKSKYGILILLIKIKRLLVL